jgi:hypothetical protein
VVSRWISGVSLVVEVYEGIEVDGVRQFINGKGLLVIKSDQESAIQLWELVSFCHFCILMEF